MYGPKAIDGNLDSIIAWRPLDNLNYPHAYMPAVGYIDDSIFVIGGGDFYMSDMQQKVNFVLATTRTSMADNTF